MSISSGPLRKQVLYQPWRPYHYFTISPSTCHHLLLRNQAGKGKKSLYQTARRTTAGTEYYTPRAHITEGKNESWIKSYLALPGVFKTGSTTCSLNQGRERGAESPTTSNGLRNGLCAMNRAWPLTTHLPSVSSLERNKLPTHLKNSRH